jgi:hypothetical protein
VHQRRGHAVISDRVEADLGQRVAPRALPQDRARDQ